MTLSHCPKCNANFQGAPIPQEYIDRGLYGKKTHYSRLIGIEIRGQYDGISQWLCPDCKYTWDRFTGKEITQG